MKILVTGGAGYVGSAIARHLAASGHAVTAYDSMADGSYAAVPPPVELMEGDVRDRDELSGAVWQCDPELIVHAAALASVPDSIGRPSAYWEANVIGTRNVLEAMRGTKCRKIVFLSTAAVYSHHQDMPLKEVAKIRPVTPYGDTKLAAEMMIHAYAIAYSMAYSIFRPFNVAGSTDGGLHGESRKDERHLIPRIFRAILDRRCDLTVHGTDYLTSPDGTCVRDYVHVSDVAEAVRLAAEGLEVGRSDVYNVCAVRASVREVIAAATVASGKTVVGTLGPRRTGDPGTLTGDNTRLRERLGWAPKFDTIERIVASAWEWFSTHPDGYAG